MLPVFVALARGAIYCAKMLYTTGEPFIYSNVLRSGSCVSVEVDVTSRLFISAYSSAPLVVTRYLVQDDGGLRMDYNGTSGEVITVDSVSFGKALFVYRAVDNGLVSVGYGGFNRLAENCSRLIFDNDWEVDSTFLRLPITETTCFLYASPGTHTITMSMGKCYYCPNFRAYTGVEHLLASITSGGSTTVSQPFVDTVSYIVVEPPQTGESDVDSLSFSIRTDQTMPINQRQIRAIAVAPATPEKVLHTRYIVDIAAYSFIAIFVFGIFVLAMFVFCKSRNWGKREKSIGQPSPVKRPHRRTSVDFLGNNSDV